MMTGAIKKSLKAQIQTSEKGTNTELVYAQIQKNEHIVTFLQTLREYGSNTELVNAQIQKNEHIVTFVQTLREYGSKTITKYQSTLSPSKSKESL